ncbi:MAG TPA: DUF4129 domain-containing protein [Rectinemataceae bacterium]|nr:DUF4129 domain-containing protein [Rectinemataceae bacterium]
MRHDFFGGSRARAQLRPLVLVSLLALAAASVGAAGATAPPSIPGASLRIRSLSFEPRGFHAGEAVVARALLETAGTDLEPFSLGATAMKGILEAAPELEIVSASLSKNGSAWVYSVGFISWAPGAGLIPPLSIGGRLFPTLDFVAQPTSGAGDRLPGPRRPQADPPGSALYLYASVAILAALALLSLAFVFWVLPGALALLESWRSREALRRLQKTLDWLEENAEGSEGRAWFALLSRSLRVYLARRLIPAAEALTPGELAALPAATLPGGDFRESLASLFAASDAVRFADRPSAAVDRADALRLARDIARRSEEGVEVSAKEAAVVRP